jgi:LmbE family N-acetylglucosaminyl deacetylase
LLPWKKFRGPVLIVAAHPDDETLGLGGQFGSLPDAYLIHVTDGAPRSTPLRCDYAATRRRELEAAMDLAGLNRRRRLQFGAIDQESSFSLLGLTRLLSERLAEIRPEVIVTHPYEGGHPDHDACAFIVQTAVRLLGSGSTLAPLRVEFTSYHNGDPFTDCNDMKVGEFLPGPPSSTISLSPLMQERKHRMLMCFETQQHFVKRFPIGVERFRLAPCYDFSQPPHPGMIFYEDKNWGVTGTQWRHLAVAALADLQTLT